jgi:hypothetical protein
MYEDPEVVPQSAYELRQKRAVVELRNIKDPGFVVSPYGININSSYRFAGDGYTSYTHSSFPWELQFGTNAYVHIINNNGGFIADSPNIPDTATVSIGKVIQTAFGTVEFGRNNPTFRNWILGGNTAMNVVHPANVPGDQPIAIGIKSDPSGVIYGTEGLRLATIETVFGIDI